LEEGFVGLYEVVVLDEEIGVEESGDGGGR
jgi:hypothetical protein